MKHKILRTIVSLTLLAVSLFSLASGVFAYKNASVWAKSELNEAEMLGFLPESMKNLDMQEPITRKEMSEVAALAYEKLTGNVPFPNRTDYFTDTTDALICAAHEIGIVNGYPDNTFRPDNLLTRQEFFVLVYNLYGAIGVPTKVTQDYLKSFPDRKQVESWAETPAQVMVGLGIVGGTKDAKGTTILAPVANTSRQEAVVMFLRGYKNIEFYLSQKWLSKEQMEAEIKALEAAAEKAGGSAEAQKLIKYALTFVGKPYVFGATGPNSFDCSGFTKYVYKHFGYNINRVAQDQFKNGTGVEYKNLKPGDMVFFSNTYSSSEWITHVGIYIGEGKMVHAANSQRGITVDSITSGYYYNHYAGARRILK